MHWNGKSARFGASLAALLLFASHSFAQQKRQIRVAAAGDLQAAMPELARVFELQTGIHAEVQFGSSGNFFAQIQNGAPLDVFFSADSDYPRKLEAAGFAAPHSGVVYAIGSIVIWMPASASCDLPRLGWRCLLDPGIKRIAIANPDHAPYGRAAVAALRSAGLYDQLQEKLVLGENISQAALFVQSGNAEAGILAHALTLAPALRDGKRWEIPASLYPRIEQSVIVLKSANDAAAADEFVKFATSGPGRKILLNSGFRLPAVMPAAAAARQP